MVACVSIQFYTAFRNHASELWQFLILSTWSSCKWLYAPVYVNYSSTFLDTMTTSICACSLPALVQAVLTPDLNRLQFITPPKRFQCHTILDCELAWYLNFIYKSSIMKRSACPGTNFSFLNMLCDRGKTTLTGTGWFVGLVLKISDHWLHALPFSLLLSAHALFLPTMVTEIWSFPSLAQQVPKIFIRLQVCKFSELKADQQALINVHEYGSGLLTTW